MKNPLFSINTPPSIPFLYTLLLHSLIRSSIIAGSTTMSVLFAKSPICECEVVVPGRGSGKNTVPFVQSLLTDNSAEV